MENKLNPITRAEQILSGEDLKPITRMEWFLKKAAEGGGSGGGAIIDVTELPTENIREDVFYRSLSGTVVQNGQILNNSKCYVVAELPQVGESVGGQTNIVAYYNTQDGIAYGYVDDTLAQLANVPVGWYRLQDLGAAFGMPFGGIYSNLADALDAAGICIVLEYAIYSYKVGKWTTDTNVGRFGDGLGAVIIGNASCQAEGNFSFAQGFSCTASGECAVATGAETGSHGYGSMSEGIMTAARGKASHSEGRFTEANSECQHVQGRRNIVDNEGKYLHIVGNGVEYPSNAHTLDWDGNAWFAGSVEGTELILKSTSGKRFKITVNDSGNLTATEI